MNSLKPVVNGTGIILRTGLGRPPISKEVLVKGIKNNDNQVVFRANGSSIKFKGMLVIYQDTKDEDKENNLNTNIEKCGYIWGCDLKSMTSIDIHLWRKLESSTNV